MSSLNIPIYMDYSATTPVDERVAKAMAECLTSQGIFGNPASRSHPFGWRAEELVEKARKDVADLIGADPREIVWTSGATESDNLAIKGAARFNVKRGKHIVTMKTEHKAVLDTCRQLEREGFDVTYLEPLENGLLDFDAFEAALRDDTTVVSIMHVNNEIGVIQDLARIGGICRERGIVFHVDAAQSPGKVPIDVDAMKVDLMSLCAHKVYGPKGIGALYVRRKPRVRLEAQIHGGGHERGMRSGTLPTHQIVGMGEAYRLCAEQFDADHQHLITLRQQFVAGLSGLEGVHFNTDIDVSAPGILNLAFEGVDGEAMLMALRGIAISTGSACNSASVEPSFVLTGIGVPRPLALASLRFSFGRFTTAADIESALGELRHALTSLRA